MTKIIHDTILGTSQTTINKNIFMTSQEQVLLPPQLDKIREDHEVIVSDNKGGHAP